MRSFAINSGGDIFAGTFYGGIYRSTDNGENWTAVNNGLTGLYIPALAINASGQIFAATWDVKACTGIFRSTDNGDSWTEINNGLANLCILSFAINENGDIFAGGDGLGGPAGVFRSTNNGDSWESVLDTAGNVNGLTVTPAGAIFAGTYGNGAFRSTDDGNTWTQVNTGLTAPFVISLTANQSGNIFAGTYFGGGVFRSTDNGDTWVEKNNGVVATDVRAIARLFPSPPVSPPQHLRRLNRYSFLRARMGLACFGHLIVVKVGRRLTMVFLLFTLDHWPSTVGGIFLGADFVGGAGGVYRSTDDGDSWVEINHGVIQTDVRALAINASGHIFAGTYLGGGVFRSTDNGR